MATDSRAERYLGVRRRRPGRCTRVGRWLPGPTRRISRPHFPPPPYGREDIAVVFDHLEFGNPEVLNHFWSEDSRIQLTCFALARPQSGVRSRRLVPRVSAMSASVRVSQSSIGHGRWLLGDVVVPVEGGLRIPLPGSLERDSAGAEVSIARLGCTRDRALLACYVSSGARASELLGIRLPDIDRQGGKLWVISKGSRLRQPVPVSPEALAYLAGYLDELTLTFLRAKRNQAQRALATITGPVALGLPGSVRHL
ncbi:tyrosine-type recombinase/integrase [Nocardia sp. NPDC101769]|uniref:tyrosine-type recombinase/integrase n=1 Tax=Nocardia sp. NPDC101769 TaxID=3364333 RepID=UPI0038001A53